MMGAALSLITHFIARVTRKCQLFRRINPFSADWVISITNGGGGLMGRLPDSKRHLQENLFFLQEQLGTDFFGQFVGAGDVGAGFG